MKKSVLITGGNTFLGQHLIEQYIRQGWSVATAVTGNSEAGETKQEQKESLLIIPWNRNSIFSAKTVVREAARSFDQIDEFVILHQPPVINTNFEETAIADLDDVVDECVNGTVYLTREILDYCSDKNDILLSYALQGDLGESGPAMTDGSAGFFRYFARGILGRKRDGLYQTAYYSPKQDHKGFAEFIFKYNQERKDKGNGEWLKYSDKKPLFSQIPVIKKEF